MMLEASPARAVSCHETEYQSVTVFVVDAVGRSLGGKTMSAMRKKFLVSTVSGLLMLAAGSAGAETTAADAKAVSIMLQATKTEPLKVYKSPTCGCCGDWI